MAKNIQTPQNPRKSGQKISLHKHIATGGKPKDYQGCAGVTPETVPGVTYRGPRKY